MTDLSFDAAEITAAIQKNLEGFDPSVESGTVGRILEVGDGIARVSAVSYTHLRAHETLR